MKIVINGETVEVPSGGTSTENYSTEETVIGTWIDGRPLYCRAAQLSPVFETGDSSPKLCDAISFDDPSNMVPVDVQLTVFRNDTGLHMSDYVYFVDGKIKVRASTILNGQPFCVIAKYIKLTDEGS